MWHLQLAAAPVTMGVYLIFTKEIFSFHERKNYEFFSLPFPSPRQVDSPVWLLSPMFWFPGKISDQAKTW